MRQLRNGLALVVCGIVVAALAAIVGTAWLATARNDSLREQRQLQTCRNLIAEIQRLETEPAVIRRQVIAHTELAQRIERAAADAGINTAEQLIRIDPRPRTKQFGDLGDPSARHIENATDVVFDRISLAQLVTFVFEVQGEDASRLHLSQLRLQAPHDDPLGEQWMAELTLMYLVLEPAEGTEAVARAATSGSESS